MESQAPVQEILDQKRVGPGICIFNKAAGDCEAHGLGNQCFRSALLSQGSRTPRLGAAERIDLEPV